LFEFALIRSYLIPRRGQRAGGLISAIAVGVIALVVWLVVVFLSVIEGMEGAWLSKLTALHAPLRIVPSKDYTNSYYYLADSVSHASNYTLKSLGEKRVALKSDPYAPEIDAELPRFWPEADRKGDGTLRDPVKELDRILTHLPSVATQEVEVSGAVLKIRLQGGREGHETHLTQASYLATFPAQSPHLTTLLTAPLDHPLTDGEIVLPKHFHEAGVQIGDRGHLTYPTTTLTGVQEQRLPITVAGFYDPGLMAAGVKPILVPPSLPRTINSASPSEQLTALGTNGILVWPESLQDALPVKEEIERQLSAAGLSAYFNVLSYHDYDFAKEFLQQFQSDRLLFTLIGTILLIVACSNVISLLILLINDKRKEIGILQAMGASRLSIATIFGGCGAAIGVFSSGLGIGLALLTLHYLRPILHFLSRIQGHALLSDTFYGGLLPSTASDGALSFVLIATPIIALLAGVIPAYRACKLTPAMILRAE
jgi:lipoprotein-releasing system permease protein